MGISVHFNANVLMAQRNLNVATKHVNQALQRLSTGMRVNSAADDPAGFYVGSKLNSQIRSLSVANQNIMDGINFMSTASQNLAKINDIVTRLRDLNLQGASDTIDSGTRSLIQKEANAWVEELQRIKKDASFNGINVFGDGNPSNSGIATVSATTPPPHGSNPCYKRVYNHLHLNAG